MRDEDLANSSKSSHTAEVRALQDGGSPWVRKEDRPTEGWTLPWTPPYVWRMRTATRAVLWFSSWTWNGLSWWQGFQFLVIFCEQESFYLLRSFFPRGFFSTSLPSTFSWISQQFVKSFYPGECDYSLACNLLQVLSLICARLSALFALKTAEKHTWGFVSSM